MVVGNLRPGVGGDREEGGFSHIGEAHQPHVGQELQFQHHLVALTGKSRLGKPGHLPGGGGEVLVAPAAPAALAEDEVLGIGHVLDNFVGLSVSHYGAPGHADDEIFAVLAPAAGALAVLAVGSYIFPLIAKIHQGGEIVVHPKDDAAAVAAVAAVGAALGDILLPVKGHGAVAAVAGLHGDFYLIDKHIFIAFLRCMGF